MAPGKIRRLILAGTRPAAPVVHNKLKRALTQVRWRPAPPEPFAKLSAAVTVDQGKEAITFSFFPHTEVGRQAAEDYWSRIRTMTIEPLNLSLLDKDGGAKNQVESTLLDKQQAGDHAFLKTYAGPADLRMPVPIANRDNDLLIPTVQSWELFSKIDHGALIIYPGAGYGYIWQFAGAFAEDVNRFLDAVELGSRL